MSESEKSLLDIWNHGAMYSIIKIKLKVGS